MVIIAGFCVVRDASGNIEDYINGSMPECPPGTCAYGLHNSFQVNAQILT